VSAAIVSRDHFEVLVSRAAIAVLVLDARVRETHVTVLVRQVALPSPLSDLMKVSVRPSIAILPALVALVQEPLVVALELVVEDHSIHSAALLAQPLFSIQVRAVDL
jgi:hypothetical protein